MAQFIESLIQEQEKLIQMGLMKYPKAHALTMHDGKRIIQSKIKVEMKGDITSKVKEGGIFQTLQGFFRFQRFFKLQREEEEGKTMHIFQ
jgi:hypothetical protein